MFTIYKFVKEHHLLAMIETAEEKRSSSLNLSRNELEELPIQLLKLNFLNKLYLERNLLTSIPSYHNWESLKTLALDYNNISYLPASLGQLSNLTYLNLSHNPLKTLLPEIGLLNKLEVLWLNNTEMESLPANLGNCINLHTLGARMNFLKWLPVELVNLIKLRWLTLESNMLTHLPRTFQYLPELRHLNISNNHFQRFPADLHTMASLCFINLSSNIIQDIDGETIESLSYVKKIDLCDNPLTDSWLLQNVRNISINASTSITPSEHSDSDSEDWEFSEASSDLDLTDSSDEEIGLEDPVVTLPQVARFIAAGI